jgi:excisionase family DNA binding protein
MLELATQRTEQILDRVGMTESPIPIAPVGETEPIPESPWMNAERAARYLSKGRDFVRREVQAGRLRAARIGKRGDILTRAEWLDDYVTERASPITVGRLRRV